MICRIACADTFTSKYTVNASLISQFCNTGDSTPPVLQNWDMGSGRSVELFVLTRLRTPSMRHSYPNSLTLEIAHH